MITAAGTAGAEGRKVSADSSGARDAWAPLLLAALAGALIAGRFETAFGCAALGAAGSMALRAARPRAGWLVMLGVSMTTAFVLNLYLVKGHAVGLPRILGAPPTLEGGRLGALLAVRLLGASLALHALAALWPGERAADELAGLLRPLRPLAVPVEEARVVLGLALRFMPLLGAEATRIARLQTLRAGRPPRGVRERVTRMRARLVPSLIGALERAEQVALALEARHHRGAVARGTRWPAAAGLAAVGVLSVALLWRG